MGLDSDSGWSAGGLTSASASGRSAHPLGAAVSARTALALPWACLSCSRPVLGSRRLSPASLWSSEAPLWLAGPRPSPLPCLACCASCQLRHSRLVLFELGLQILDLPAGLDGLQTGGRHLRFRFLLRQRAFSSRRSSSSRRALVPSGSMTVSWQAPAHRGGMPVLHHLDHVLVGLAARRDAGGEDENDLGGPLFEVPAGEEQFEHRDVFQDGHAANDVALLRLANAADDEALARAGCGCPCS